MLLNRFLQYFGRVSPNDPKETRIEFRSSDPNNEVNLVFTIKTVTFDVDENKWIIDLR